MAIARWRFRKTRVLTATVKAAPAIVLHQIYPNSDLVTKLVESDGCTGKACSERLLATARTDTNPLLVYKIGGWCQFSWILLAFMLGVRFGGLVRVRNLADSNPLLVYKIGS